MTTKAELHSLIDQLPERDIATAARVLAGLLATATATEEENDPVLRLLASAPRDDEPLSDEDRAAIAEGWEQYRAGQSRPLRQTAP